MLKLPKGLKKKKKGKKSKKDKELFTEEELEQYRREHQKQAVAEFEEPATPSEPTEGESSTSKPEDDDEWRKFNALATGVDSILKKTQGDLDRIKSTSFFQRVPTRIQQKKAQEEAQLEESVQEETPAEEVPEEKDNLASAVIELSESEEESEEADDIFDTTYIDVITTNELPLAYIPDSPVEDEEAGPDPFDTTYAEKVIKGPEVSKKGKKIVSIGSAVEVLTGRVETVTSTVSTKRPRRGVQNLLLDNEENEATEATTPVPEAPSSSVKTLLDDNDDVLPDLPIDLSVSLHLTLQKEKAEQNKTQEVDNKDQDVLAEFDQFKPSEPEDDEFAQLATESLSKVEEGPRFTPQVAVSSESEFSSDWAAFEEQSKSKPVRPPPPRPATTPQVPYLVNEQDLEVQEDDVDPFDTAFVDQVVLADDDDFDPRAEDKEEEPAQVVPTSDDELFSPDFPKEENLFPPRDYLGGSVTDLSTLPEVAIAPASARAKTPVELDPFDTSAVSSIVAPKEVELKFLEKEFLSDNTPAVVSKIPVVPLPNLKHSLSDPDFDPRGEEAEDFPQDQTKSSFESRPSIDIQSRKSSLSLNIQTVTPKAVSFAVPSPDLLAVGENGGKIQKPLTPYYTKEVTVSADVDPFDTSFVSDIKPTKVELSLLESDLLKQSQPLRQVQLEEDSDFDPRADTPVVLVAPVKTPDLLAVGEELNIKVLTPAIEIANAAAEVPVFDDPFDTSAVDSNILPGKAELKLIENELLPHLAKTPEPVLDILSYSQDDSLPVKALTPLGATSNSIEVEEIDPFDTSIAENLGPGKTEIKLIESELIGQE